jgi:hypothetical protein
MVKHIYVPAGNTRVPPPAADTASIARLIAGLLTVLPSPVAPKSRMLIRAWRDSEDDVSANAVHPIEPCRQQVPAEIIQEDASTRLYIIFGKHRKFIGHDMDHQSDHFERGLDAVSRMNVTSLHRAEVNIFRSRTCVEELDCC